MEDVWKSTEFTVVPYKESKDVFIVGGTDEIQQQWDDSNINISTIASSRHVGPIKARVEEWLVQLDLFGKTLVGSFARSSNFITGRCNMRFEVVLYTL